MPKRPWQSLGFPFDIVIFTALHTCFLSARGVRVLFLILVSQYSRELVRLNNMSDIGSSSELTVLYCTACSNPAMGNQQVISKSIPLVVHAGLDRQRCCTKEKEDEDEETRNILALKCVNKVDISKSVYKMTYPNTSGAKHPMQSCLSRCDTWQK